MTSQPKTATLSDVGEVVRKFREFEDYASSLGFRLTIDPDERDLDLEFEGGFVTTLAADLSETNL